MALITCSDCGAKVSDLAPACPHCGRPKEASQAPGDRYRARPAVLKTTFMVLVFIGFIQAILTMLPHNHPEASPVAAPATAATSNSSPTPHPDPPHTVDEPSGDDGYQSLLANVWVGNELYLRTDHAYIGVIQDIESDHVFPDGTQRDGILVKFANGSIDWIPRKTAQQIYVTK
jgi:hypothetical protein